MQDNLVIISNEKFYREQNNFFCDNIAEKSLPDGLNKKFKIEIIARYSANKKAHKLQINNILLFNSIFFYLFEVLKKIKKKETKFLILSISPYTFLASLLFFFFKKKPIVYLRSDGHKEYKSILGFYGPIIYHIMFTFVSKIAFFISCGEHILKEKKGEVVYPSELNNNWLSNPKQIKLDKVKLLYIGRIKIEKGIFSLLEIFKNVKNDNTLTIVGAEMGTKKLIDQKNVSVYEIENNEENLIKFYDDHSIFVLPSFTEGHPMVLLEALSRLRPVIIFKEIQHVVGDKKGIFVAERNADSFFKRVDYIKENYKTIQENMKTNQLPTKDNFLRHFGDLILNINKERWPSG